jgi:hypothetical protein
MDALLISDNWTLQNAGEFIHGGLDGKTVQELAFPSEGKTLCYQLILADLVRFDALCQFLTHLILADQIWVEKDDINSWKGFSSIEEAKASGILVPKAFKAAKEKWLIARESMADRLCINSALKKIHRQNKQQWQKSGEVVDGFLSQLIWGGAGMLARAHFVNVPYSPHPLRQSLFQQAGLVMSSGASQSLQKFIAGEQMKIYRHVGKVGFEAKLHLPPVAAQIILDSNDLQSLVTTALQIRDEFRDVRSWLAQVQADLNHEKMADVLKHRERLESIAKYLDSRSTRTSTGDTTVQFGFNLLKIGSKIDSPINALQNRFGMRAEVNRLVLGPAGREITTKLLRMLGERHTPTGRRLQEALEIRSKATSASD